jgi:hypothetical protein
MGRPVRWDEIPNVVVHLSMSFENVRTTTWWRIKLDGHGGERQRVVIGPYIITKIFGSRPGPHEKALDLGTNRFQLARRVKFNFTYKIIDTR